MPVNIVFGSGKLYWTPSGGAEVYLAETPSFSVQAEWTIEAEWHQPTGRTWPEIAAANATRVTRRGAFVAQDISTAALTLWLSVAGPARGRLRFEADNARGSDTDLNIPTVCLYPAGTWDLKNRSEPQRLGFEFLVETAADGTAPWTVAAG